MLLPLLPGEPWPEWDVLGGSRGPFPTDTRRGQRWWICRSSPSELVRRKELTKSTAKGIIKVRNFPLFPFLTAA